MRYSLGTNFYAVASQRNAMASHLAILQRCPTVISRLLKKGGSSLLAAKILVLARLTHKTLSQDADAPPLIDTLRQRLASLRSKLLNAIDKRIAAPDKDIQSLLEDMCAFSLATSSTPTDVLRHFQRVRLEAIGWHLEQSSGIKTHVLKAVKLLLDTLQESQTVFPKRLADALVKLKDQPLIKQKDVQSVSELSFDLHELWVADELRNYTPWPRHDELQKAEADKIVKNWAKQAVNTFLSAMKLVLSAENEFSEIMTLRKELLEAWPWSDSRVPGFHSADVVDQLRELLNDQLSAIVTERVEELQSVPNAILAALNRPSTPQPKELLLWDASVTSMDYSSGASSFKRAVHNRYYGYSDAITNVLDAYNTWVDGITSIRSLLKEMRDTRWDDDIGDDVDDLDSRQVLLSEDDPRALDETLSKALEESSQEVQKALEQIVHKVIKEDSDGPENAIFVLRVIRQISQWSSSRDHNIVGPALKSTSSLAITKPLHMTLGEFVTSSALKNYQLSLGKLAKTSIIPAKSLWEGSPLLPVQPTPGTFKFLRNVTMDMATHGPDLWSSGAVDAIKHSALEKVAKIMQELISRIQQQPKDKTLKTGHAENGIDDTNNIAPNEGQNEIDVLRDRLTQVIFDMAFLQHGLAQTGENGQPGGSFQPLLETCSKTLNLETTLTSRIRKSAGDYWKRTYLIFALLSPSG
jgi:hypothetical protein